MFKIESNRHFYNRIELDFIRMKDSFGFDDENFISAKLQTSIHPSTNTKVKLL